MSQPSIKTDAEIRLLTEMLADSFDEESQIPPGASLRVSECPAPAVLWALFEPAAEETAWTLRMRDHVKGCPECGSLTKRLQGFVAASEDRASISREYEAAWKSAEKRMERKLQNMLALNAQSRMKPKPEPWWKLRWLPPMTMAYALGGCAVVLLLLSGITLFLAGGKPDASSNQLAQSDADIWSQPASQGDDADRHGASEPAGASSNAPGSSPGAAQPGSSNGEVAAQHSAPGAVSTGQPLQSGPSAAEPRPTEAANPGANATATQRPELGGQPSRTIATSSEAANAAIHTLSVQLTAGMQGRIQILLVRQEGSSTIVDAALTPLSSTASPSVIFSARIGAGSAPVRLRIHMIEQDGKRMKLQGADVTAVTVAWPDKERKPLPGESFEVKVLSGTTLTSEAEKK